jgi:predicted dithiol-disulfide oxidoreductase (DUF899 family)
MSELRYPNESREYRDARDSLLKDEKELVDKVKALAAKRRTLPLGGELKEDYVFQWANDGKVGKSVKFSELFGDKNTLLLYSFMYGPNWDNPCPSCTSLVDGFDRSWYQVARDAAFTQLRKPRRIESMLGPNDVDGRRFRWFRDRPLRIKPTTSARETRMTGNCP